MQAFKVKAFARWANREGLNDDALASAVIEMEHGLIDAKLAVRSSRKGWHCLGAANAVAAALW